MNLDADACQFLGQIKPPERLSGDDGGEFIGNDKNAQSAYPTNASRSTATILAAAWPSPYGETPRAISR